MNNSIKKRLIGHFMLAITIAIVILEFFLFNIIKEYYYNSMGEILANQVEVSAEFYSRYFSSSRIEDVIIDDINIFWQQTTAQVQIVDLQGKILMDSIGSVELGERIQTSDVVKALEGDIGTWIGNVSYDTENVISVSHPLMSDGQVVGVLRFTSSLRETNRTLKNIYMVFISIGIIVILISIAFSIFLANTIVKPLNDVTKIAEKMANGQLKVRSEKRYNDEVGKLSDTLNFMAEELLRNERLKNDFISSVSHELRTPLTSIKGWTITLKTDISNDRELLKDGLNIIEDESDRLAKMVEELLDFSKLLSDRIVMKKEEINIAKSVEIVAKQLKVNADKKNITFDIDIENNLPNIIADENRIKQVLINILDNAFKFTQEGGEVSIYANRKEDNIIIKVMDNGQGIDEEDLPYIKDKFYKGKNTKSHTGLGLSISDNIVKLHGGNLEIDSKINVGTIVTVSLPIEGVAK